TFLMQAKKHPNAINYYITDVAASGNNSPGLVLAYYTPTNDWIVSRRDQINGNANNSTIPHETGHFFSLQHPFLGWESSATGFVPSSAGWPIAPVIAPDGVPTERQNGTNCTTAADKICDTGPDYKFAFSQSDCSPYDRGAKDPLGVLVDPNENNTMSYFDACSLYVFTPLQSAAMLADLNSPARNFLDNTYVPPGTITTPSDLLVSPANGSTVPFYNAVNLEWKAVTNATNYLVEIDIVPSFATGLIKTYVANTNSLLVTDLDPNDTYYWRVKPFNYSDGCANLYSRNFKVNSTPTNTIEVEGLDAWQVSPNPSNGDFARILAKSTETFEANVYMLDATGRIVMDMPSVQFVEGQNSIELTLSGLANGFYFVVIDNGTAKDLRKLIIAR
ncbi:MAG: T9SS type A sorting domain-containing protein, partial [Saprospiraceae bacterium]|nr:T9SS type A sorting domain-containing protein [Saprospiraceae bacterium]